MKLIPFAQVTGNPAGISLTSIPTCIDMARRIAGIRARIAVAGRITRCIAGVACMPACIVTGRITGDQARVPTGKSSTGDVACVPAARCRACAQTSVACVAGVEACKHFTCTPACPPCARHITRIVARIQACNARVVVACRARVPARLAGTRAGEARYCAGITGVLTSARARVACKRAGN